MKTFLTSDTHFGHKNITGKELSSWDKNYRTFSSIEEMDNTLLEEINTLVGKNDILIHHGDFAFKNHEYYLDQIECRNIWFISGNHDSVINKKKELQQRFRIYEPKWLNTVIENKFFFMCHYKFLSWPGMSKNVLHTFGHSHGNIPEYLLGKSMDVGVDNAFKHFGKYRPFFYEEVVEIINSNEIFLADHH